MHIRPAEASDLPAMIELLGLSLGGVDTPKTEAFWQWKHRANPFGSSPVLLAEKDGRLVGLRAFLRWQWRQGEHTYRALRPVDTATHPDYRRQGIFRRLTLELLEECRAAGHDFLFNTPNPRSRKGYLQMGWQVAGRLPVRLRLQLTGQHDPNTAADFQLADALQRFDVLPPVSGKRLHTPKDPAFLRWRYLHCPVVDYFGYADAHQLLIFRQKPRPRAMELRICEWFRRPGHPRKAARRALRQIARAFGASLISRAPRLSPAASTKGGHMGPFFLPTLPVGPVVTLRELNTPLAALPAVRYWQYSLGDMELF